MNARHIHPEARDEYEALMQRVVTEATGTKDRVDLMLHLIDRMLGTGQDWSEALYETALRTGLRHEIHNYLKRTRIVVNTRDGREVEKPQVIGVKRLDAESGTWVDTQLPLEVLTFDEIRAKRQEYLTIRAAYDDSVALADKLLALEIMALGARTPEQACRRLGKSLADYLAA